MVLPGSSASQSADAGEVYTPQTNAQPTLADLLTIESSTSIFYTYARETRISELFVDEHAQITLLVPTNKAVMALARKPHQDPAKVEDGTIISEEEFDAIAKNNVQRWVSAHIIPRSPISLLSAEPFDTLLADKSVAFEQVSGDVNKPDWERVRLSGGVPLLGMKEACNGVMYILDGTVKLN
ncbi:hypothetical protein SCP_0101420 [Sparassis crispa]|uniref:FAS1 domain-containing protein n=1 Tax=Sparassis crispa TaxID=139825 RepID=A0A401G537_9APHY|nr:hypothetical protein SCP_0101420 [Sparassis crispa]GBE77269.1 hypothetical protein SCP_0101420 [Sparassis crispa]